MYPIQKLCLLTLLDGKAWQFFYVSQSWPKEYLFYFKEMQKVDLEIA